jgi:hypothetical protein
VIGLPLDKELAEGLSEKGDGEQKGSFRVDKETDTTISKHNIERHTTLSPPFAVKEMTLCIHQV